MKKFDRMKTVELFLFVAIAAVCFYKIVLASDIYQQITTNQDLMVLCVFLWVTLFLSFICIFVDFSLYSSQNRTLNYLDEAANTDTVANIANRYSIDTIIDEYAEKDIPAGMGCAMIELSSLGAVNSKYGRAEGNRLIRNFSIILKMSSLDDCIVGRNGGNRFIVLYEDKSDMYLEVFLDRLKDKVADHNLDKRNHIIEYNFGTAYAERDDISVITQLIALSSRNLNEKLAGLEEAALRAEPEAANLMPESNFDVIVEEDLIGDDSNLFGEEADDYIPLIKKLTPEEIELIAYQKSLRLDTKRTRAMIRKAVKR